MQSADLPIPPHFDSEAVGRVWRVPYQRLAGEAAAWAEAHSIPPATEDAGRICLLAVDLQNTFCIPGFELYVGGRSGTGAVDDNRRLCRFVYRNLARLTAVVATLDTHRPLQIFHSLFLLDERGRHPEPYALISKSEVEDGKWRVDPEVCAALGLDPDYARRHLLHYTKALERDGRYRLTVWPYHALLGGIGHALASAVEEAFFFHSIARRTQPVFQIKGDRLLTESYSALGPEVLTGPDGQPIGDRSRELQATLESYDAVIVAGQAKSHCVAWTVADLLTADGCRPSPLAGRLYLLEDCTSPVVVPGAADYTDEADRAFARFAEAGAHLVRSTTPITDWPGLG